MSAKKNTCPIGCNLKIDELKKWIQFALNTLHDTIVDTTDESEEWYEGFMDEIDTINENVENI